MSFDKKKESMDDIVKLVKTMTDDEIWRGWMLNSTRQRKLNYRNRINKMFEGLMKSKEKKNANPR